MVKKTTKNPEQNFITKALFHEEIKKVEEKVKPPEPIKTSPNKPSLNNRFKRALFKVRSKFKYNKERLFMYLNERILSRIRFEFLFKVFLEINLYGIMAWLAIRNITFSNKIFIYINYTYLNMIGYGSLVYLILEIIERIISAVRQK